MRSVMGFLSRNYLMGWLTNVVSVLPFGSGGCRWLASMTAVSIRADHRHCNGPRGPLPMIIYERRERRPDADGGHGGSSDSMQPGSRASVSPSVASSAGPGRPARSLVVVVITYLLDRLIPGPAAAG
jgi:hypothetical protein